MGLRIDRSGRALVRARLHTLASEHYELVVPAQDKLPPMFLELIAAAEFQQADEALGGYDLKESGQARQAAA